MSDPTESMRRSARSATTIWLIISAIALFSQYHEHTKYLRKCHIFFDSACNAQWEKAGDEVWWGIIPALLIAVLIYRGALGAARSRQEAEERKQQSEETQKRERAEALRRKELSAARLVEDANEIQRVAQEERIKEAREAFVRDIFLTTDLVDLLKSEDSGPDSKVMRVRISQNLQDLVAPYPSKQIEAIVREDKGIEIALRRLLEKLDEIQFNSSAGDVLNGILGRNPVDTAEQ